MSNETQASHFPGYFATNNGDQLAASISLANLTKDNYNPVDSITANGVNDLRRDVAKSEADIKEALGKGFCDTIGKIGDSECRIASKVGSAECSIIGEVNEVNRNLGLHIANSERDIQNRIHEARIEALRTNTELSRYLSDKTDLVKSQLTQFERNTDENFCKVRTEVKDSERRILDKLASDKLDEKNEIIDELRHSKNYDRYSSQFALQTQDINYLKQMLNSVEQNQRFSSKTVQFGAGNVAIPTQTANQG